MKKASIFSILTSVIITSLVAATLVVTASGNNTTDDFYYSAQAKSITFYLQEIPLNAGEEYNVNCYTEQSSANLEAVSAKSKTSPIILDNLNPSTTYSCQVRVIAHIDNGTQAGAKIETYKSNRFSVRTSTQLRIISEQKSTNSLTVEVNNLEIKDSEVYFIECNSLDNPSNYVPHRTSKTTTISITNLDWYSNYQCHAGVGLTPTAGTDVREIYQVSENTVQISTSGKSEVSTDNEIQFADPVNTQWDTYVAPFPDIYMNTLSGQAVAELYRRGVVTGHDSDGTFHGNEDINRAETTKMLLKTRYKVIPDFDNTFQFQDILNGRWYTKYITMASQKNVIHGYPDKTFRPNNSVNTAEFLKMLVRTFDLPQNLPHSYTDVPEGSWFEAYVGAAEKMNLFPGRTEKIYPNDPVSRYQAAVAIYQALKYKNNTQL